MFKFKPNISRRSSYEMIMLSAKHGNHYHSFNLISDADVKRVFSANGFDFEKVVAQCRNYFAERVPIF